MIVLRWASVIMTLIVITALLVGIIALAVSTLVWPWLSQIIDLSGTPSTGNFQLWGAR